MSRLQLFFLQCAGADSSLLKNCPSESAKFVGIGASIFFTGIFASLAAGYALYTVFDNVFWSFLFALLWGAMIFNLDRFIVSSMRKNGDQKKEWLTALPRIALAVLISLVLARPLELKIFEKEIENEILLMQQEDKNRKIAEVSQRFVEDRNRLQSEIENLRKEINSKVERRDALRKIAQEEADGTGGTMQRNAGPIYQIKKSDADRVEQELQVIMNLNEPLIYSRENQLARLADEEEEAKAAVTEGQLTGLASRLEAMDRLTQKSEAIWTAHTFILLLFVFIETAPIFVKLISSRGSYDFELKKQEYGHETAYYEELAMVNHLIKKRAQKLSTQEKDYLIKRLNVSLEQT